MRGSLKDTCVEFDYFSVALDESTGLKGTAQLDVFIRGVMPNLDIDQLMAMNDTTTRKDIFIALQRVLTEMKLDLSKLISVTTDGAPTMVGQEKDVVFLLERRMKDLGFLTKSKTSLHHSSRATVRKISQTEGSNRRGGKNSKFNSVIVD